MSGAPKVTGVIERGGRGFTAVDFRPISPEIVEFAQHGRTFYETARWVSGRYRTDELDAQATTLCAPDWSPLQKIPEWRPPEHQLTRWAFTNRQGTGWLDKNRPPVGDCKLEIKSGAGTHAITITVVGHRTTYKVDRGDATPPLIGEKLLSAPLLSVIREVEEAWDRWWWEWSLDVAEEPGE